MADQDDEQKADEAQQQPPFLTTTTTLEEEKDEEEAVTSSMSNQEHGSNNNNSSPSIHNVEEGELDTTPVGEEISPGEEEEATVDVEPAAIDSSASISGDNGEATKRRRDEEEEKQQEEDDDDDEENATTVLNRSSFPPASSSICTDMAPVSPSTEQQLSSTMEMKDIKLLEKGSIISPIDTEHKARQEESPVFDSITEKEQAMTKIISSAISDKLERGSTLGRGSGSGGNRMAETNHDVEAVGGEPIQATTERPLAVAMPLNGIPDATEFDPHAKPPPIFHNRRLCLYLCFALLLGALTVGLVSFKLLQRNKDDDDNDDFDKTGNGDGSPSTMAPTTYREARITEQLHRLISDGLEAGGRNETLILWDDPTSPHSRAMEWILHTDPRQVEAEDPFLGQRFILALFYYSTTRDGPWLSCNPPGVSATSPSATAATNVTEDENKEEEDDDDVCIYQQLAGIYPLQHDVVPSIRWLSSRHECEWASLQCDDFNQVRGFENDGQGMTGVLPPELALLPFVQTVDLAWNLFTGTIPHEYGSMKHMLNFEVHHNFLTGSIPESFWYLLNMQRLTLAGNLLTGSVPSIISELRDIKGFFIYSNLLTGSIPSEVGTLDSLSYARLNSNLFEGELPTEIGKMTECEELFFRRNLLEGTLPSEIGHLRKMRDLRVGSNSLKGTIPSELWELHELEVLDLFTTHLSGTIATEIGLMSNLRILRMSESLFYGEIPSEMGLLTALERVLLEGNNFAGSVPHELCELRGPYTLQDLSADCMPTEMTGLPAVECQTGCCTKCCDRDSGECISY